MKHTASIFINASPMSVYSLVSNITNMGKFSPECYRCEWLDNAKGPAVGARFQGWNKSGRFEWDTISVILVHEPGKKFSFQPNSKHATHMIWTYTFEEVNGGTKLTESCEGKTKWLAWPILKLLGRDKITEEGMRTTLARIKAAAEEK